MLHYSMNGNIGEMKLIPVNQLTDIRKKEIEKGIADKTMIKFKQLDIMTGRITSIVSERWRVSVIG